jgi:hypothetical protein
LGNLIELLLDLAGVADLDELVVETALQKAGHRLADRRGLKAPVLLDDVTPVLDDVEWEDMTEE